MGGSVERELERILLSRFEKPLERFQIVARHEFKPKELAVAESDFDLP